jgi:hypothetical protein
MPSNNRQFQQDVANIFPFLSLDDTTEGLVLLVKPFNTPLQHGAHGSLPRLFTEGAQIQDSFANPFSGGVAASCMVMTSDFFESRPPAHLQHKPKLLFQQAPETGERIARKDHGAANPPEAARDALHIALQGVQAVLGADHLVSIRLQRGDQLLEA